jgi:RecA/RadA recombinase
VGRLSWRSLLSPSIRVYSPSELPPLVWRPSGVPLLDRLVPGVPGGRITEISGPKGLGKTLLALHYKPDIFIDVEHTAEPSWFGRFAPDCQVVRPACSEEAWEVVQRAAEAKVRCVVLDSLGAMVTSQELDSDAPAALSRDVSKNLRKIIPALDVTALIVVNQVRLSFNSRIPGLLTTPGGEFFHHAVSLHLSLKPRGEWVVVKGVKIGHGVRVHIEKSKVCAPHREVILFVGYQPGGLYGTEDELKEAYRGNGAGERRIEDEPQSPPTYSDTQADRRVEPPETPAPRRSAVPVARRKRTT